MDYKTGHFFGDVVYQSTSDFLLFPAAFLYAAFFVFSMVKVKYRFMLRLEFLKPSKNNQLSQLLLAISLRGQAEQSPLCQPQNMS